MPLNGLIKITPTSVTVTGTSASIGSGGQVTFTAMTELHINGVFSSSYDNYLVVCRHANSQVAGLFGRLRNSGTTATTNYRTQNTWVNATGLQAGNGNTGTSGTSLFGNYNYATSRSGFNAYIFNPFASTSTVCRLLGQSESSSASLYEFSGSHSTASSYDSLTLITDGGNSTGTVTIYGFNK